MAVALLRGRPASKKLAGFRNRFAKEANAVGAAIAQVSGECDQIFRDLARDPARKDLAWHYGVGSDVLDPKLRTAEFGNWLTTEVLPAAARR